jgi:hypothetical protein
MESNPGNRAIGRQHGRNLDAPQGLATDREQGGGAAVAEDDRGGRPAVRAEQDAAVQSHIPAAGEDRRHPSTVGRQGRAPDRVDPTGNEMEAAARKAMLDPTARQSERQELSPGHHPVLSAGQSPRPGRLAGHLLS